MKGLVTVILAVLEILISFRFILYDDNVHLISQHCQVELRQKMRLIVIVYKVLILKVLVLVLFILILSIEVRTVKIKQTVRQLVACYCLNTNTKHIKHFINNKNV